MPRSMATESTSESDSETETETETATSEGGGYRGGYYPPYMHHHHHHHQHHHHHHHHHHPGFSMGYQHPMEASPGMGVASEVTGDTNATELAARERARTLLLEFRETKMNLQNLQKALESSQAENEKLNQALYQQRMLFSKERTEFNTHREAWERNRAALEDTVPANTKTEINDLSSSVIQAAKEKAGLIEDLRIQNEKLEEFKKKYVELERDYAMQESEVQVLREVVETERERNANNMQEAETRYSEKVRATEKSVTKDVEAEHTKMLTDIMRELEMVRAERDDLAARSHVPTHVPSNSEVVNRMSAEIGYLKEELSKQETSSHTMADEIISLRRELETARSQPTPNHTPNLDFLSSQQTNPVIPYTPISANHQPLAPAFSPPDNQELFILKRESIAKDSEIQSLKEEIMSLKVNQRQLQTMAAASRLHQQADTTSVTQVKQMQESLLEMEAEVAAAAKRVSKEERRHATTKQKLEAIIREQDKVLNVLERANSDKTELKARVRREKKATDELREANSILNSEVTLLSQQLDIYKNKYRETNVIRQEVERQRDGLGSAVRMATEGNMQQQEVLEREKAALQVAMKQREAEYGKEKRQLEELLQKDIDKKIDERGKAESQRQLENKCHQLEAKLELLMSQRPVQPQQQLPPPPDSPEYQRQSQAPQSPAHFVHSPAKHVEQLASQLTSKERELFDLRTEMDSLRSIVETTRPHLTPVRQPYAQHMATRSGPL